MKELFEILKSHKYKLSAAESCTGGALMNELTDIPGSSRIFECGFVTYSDKSKFRILGVNPNTISVHGAVSEETVGEMLDGLLAETDSEVLCAVSGIAGPEGGTDDKPVGTVYAGFCLRSCRTRNIIRFNFTGDRKKIKKQTVNIMIAELKKILKKGLNC